MAKLTGNEIAGGRKSALLPVSAIAAAIALLGVLECSAALVTQPLDGGGTALVVSGTAFTQEETDALNNNTVTELWKAGTGTLVSSGIGSFTGIIRVKGGILQVAAQDGLGTTAGATYVESGATLEQTSNDVQLKEPMFLEGTGMDEKGAYYSSDDTAKKSPGLAGGPITLTGDTLLVGRRQWYFQPSAFDMGGHTLTLSNINHQCVFKAPQITDAGHILVTQGTIWLSNGCVLKNGAEHTLTLTNSTTMSLYGYTTLDKADWKIVYSTKNTGNAVYIAKTSSGSPSHWYGPIEILEGYTLRAALSSGATDYGWQEFWGPISGKGNFSITDGNVLEGVRLYGTNTYEGTTSAPNSGQLWFMHRKALPSTSSAKYVMPGGTAKMYLPLREDGSSETFLGWTAADLKDVYTGFSGLGATSHPLLAYIATDKTFTSSSDFDTETSSHNVRQRYCGGGKVRLTGDFIGRPLLRLETNPDDGTQLEIDGSGTGRHNEYGEIVFYDGKFLLKDMNHWFTSETDEFAKFNVSVVSISPKSRVTFGAGTSMGQTIRRVTEGFNLVHGDAGTCGTLEFLDGCAFTNKLVAAYSKDQSAAIYQRGGDVYLTNGGGNDGVCGDGGYGFFEKTGGKLAIRAWTRFGKQRSGVGILHMADDWTMEESSLAISAGGTGVLYQTSGTLSANGASGGALSICNANYATAWGGHGNITVRGSNACVYVKNDAFYMSDCSISESYVNMMDGGTMWMAQIRKQGETTFRNGYPISNTVAYVNFNGGALKSTGLNKNLFGAGAQAPDRVTVFGGGAIIDSDTYTVTNNISLQAPTGKGLASIAFPAEFDATGYMGPPVVTIDGDGVGATALCEYDSTNQVVTGITVTSPGWDYTTATVTLSRGGKTGTVACTATLADNATTGGFTKRGAGTLVLSEANTYGGKTRIEEGALRTAAAGAIPSGSEIEIAGGTLAVGEGMPVPEELTVDLSAYNVAEGKTGRWTLMTVDGGAAFEPPVVHGLESGWMAAKSGNALLLKRIKGFAFSVR